MRITISHICLFTTDPATLAGFYQRVFGFPEIANDRSPIFVGLNAGNTRLGFHAHAAYALLNLDGRAKHDDSVGCYFTIEVETDAAVDALAEAAVAAGARLIKPPYDTYYDARQCVLEDPEGNLFRMNHARGPSPWPS